MYSNFSPTSLQSLWYNIATAVTMSCILSMQLVTVMFFRSHWAVCDWCWQVSSICCCNCHCNIYKHCSPIFTPLNTWAMCFQEFW